MKKQSILILFMALSCSVISQTKNDIIETIKVGGVAEVYFTHDDQKGEIQKTVSGNPAPEVIVNFKNGVLVVDTEGEAHNEVVKVYVSSRHLKNIVVDDAAQFHGTNKILSKTLAITVNGSSSADLAIQTKHLDITMNGGDLDISGESKNWAVRNGNDHERGTLRYTNLTIKNEE